MASNIMNTINFVWQERSARVFKDLHEERLSGIHKFSISDSIRTQSSAHLIGHLDLIYVPYFKEMYMPKY